MHFCDTESHRRSAVTKIPHFFFLCVSLKKSLAFVFAFTVDWKLFMLLCIVGILERKKTLLLEEIVC